MPRKWNLEFTKDWVNSIPKYINSNGCWIPIDNKPDTDGYIRIMNNGVRYKLHRLVLCIYHNLNYNDRWVARHGILCDKACFFVEHLQIGTDSDNQLDAVKAGTHFNASKEVCPKCNWPYSTRETKTGRVERFCRNCAREYDRKRYRKNKNLRNQTKGKQP